MNRLLSTGFGLVMLAAAALQSDTAALILCAAGVGLVLLGNVFRPSASLAVVCAGAALTLDDPVPMVAALSGLSAAAYLVVRHSVASAPTVVGAVGFTAVGAGAATVPLQWPWVPLAAPLLVLGLVVLVSRPFWSQGLRSVK